MFLDKLYIVKSQKKSSFCYNFSEETLVIATINNKCKKWRKKMKKVWSMDKTLIVKERSAGAVTQRCSVKGFWKIAHNSQENICAGVSF